MIDADTDPAQIEALVEEARAIPREELRAKVNAVLAERARPRAVPPPPPTTLDTPLRQEEHEHAQRFAAGLGVIGAALAADPAYVALSLCKAFQQINWVMLRLHEKPVRELVASTSPEEMAAAILADDPRGKRFGSEAQRFERDIKPILEWYARVGQLLNDPPATIRRVK